MLNQEQTANSGIILGAIFGAILGVKPWDKLGAKPGAKPDAQLNKLFGVEFCAIQSAQFMHSNTLNYDTILGANWSKMDPGRPKFQSSLNQMK